MISLSGPAHVAPGTTVCVTVTGYTGTLDSEGTFNEEALSDEVVIRPNGVAKISFTLPAAAEGMLFIQIEDDSGASDSTVIFVR